MIPYIIVFLILLVLSFKIKNDKYGLCDYLFILIICSFSAIRGVGTDYGLYKYMYNSITAQSIISSRTGVGFQYIEHIFRNILMLDYQWLIILVVIITNILIFNYVKKNTNNPGLAMIMYVGLGFYTTSFNMFRQMLSFAFLITGYNYYVKKNSKIKMFICYIIALLIHSSSLVGIVAYTVFSKVKIKVPIVLLISFFILIIYDNLFSSILKAIPSYSMYLNYEAIPGIGTKLMVLVYFIIYFIFIIPNREKLIKKNKKNENYFFFVTIGIGIMLLELKNYLFFRIASYFTFFIIFLISDIYDILNIQKQKALSLVFYSLVLVYFLTYVFSFDGVVPYRTFLNN